MRDLGDKFKAAERALDIRVPGGGYVVVRIDGKAFHALTRHFNKPFDKRVTEAINFAMRGLCEDTDMPVVFGYVQSDEISLLVKNDVQPYFGGRVQKISSVAASYAAAFFNDGLNNRLAAFDARVLHLPTTEDVYQYFLWRKADANKNAISSLAQTLFSHKTLQGKNRREMLEMIAQVDERLLPIDSGNFNGRYMYPEKVFVSATDHLTGLPTQAQRTRWQFMDDDKMLLNLMSQLG